MTERPDLDAIEQCLGMMEKPKWYHAWPSTFIYKGGVNDLDALLTYARALEAERDRLQEALIWCSGSGDFAPEGKAREGWQRICQPLLP